MAPVTMKPADGASLFRRFMRILLVPDPTSPTARTRSAARFPSGAAARGHETQVCVIPNEPVEATLDRAVGDGLRRRRATPW